MTAQQVRAEIAEILENLDESSLQKVHEYLTMLKSLSKEDRQLAANLKKILDEDKELLKKLAE
jgi:uncharacterized protein YeeX (DUF496 family)